MIGSVLHQQCYQSALLGMCAQCVFCHRLRMSSINAGFHNTHGLSFLLLYPVAFPAAIVGGMVGALWGAAAIPSSMTGPVLDYGEGSGGQTRPAFLHARQLPDLFDRLWDTAKR